MKFKTKWNLFAVILCYLLIIIFTEHWIITEDLFFRNLPSQISIYTIDGILESREKFWWLSYLLQIVVVFCKVFFAAICIFIGVLLSEINYSFYNLLRPVVIAEFIYIFAQVIYSINLYLNKTVLNFDTMANYFPLSMLSFYGVENVVSWLHYPLQTLNIFLLLYLLLISWLLSKKWEPDFVESLNIVLPSYGIGLLLWMVLVVFLTLQIS